MLEKNVVSWNAMLSWFAQNELWKRLGKYLIKCWLRMKFRGMGCCRCMFKMGGLRMLEDFCLIFVVHIFVSD